MRDIPDHSFKHEAQMTMHDDAQDRAQACGQAQAEMPRYQCHKKVWALKIKDIVQVPADYERINAGGDWYIVPEENGYARIVVGHDDFILRHKPEIGGYYVVYEDGYKSYSPAKPFEDGYTLISTSPRSLAGVPDGR